MNFRINMILYIHLYDINVNIDDVMMVYITISNMYLCSATLESFKPCISLPMTATLCNISPISQGESSSSHTLVFVRPFLVVKSPFTDPVESTSLCNFSISTLSLITSCLVSANWSFSLVLEIMRQCVMSLVKYHSHSLMYV